jgi:predicted RNA-binding protein (virulence factor B family)
MGKTLTQYTASQHNCQDYILNILKATTQLANTTVPSNISNFIYQDISKVLAPTSTTSKIANKVTDLSHVLNRIGQVVGIGTGLDDNNVEISSKDKSKIDKLISKKLHF